MGKYSAVIFYGGKCKNDDINKENILEKYIIISVLFNIISYYRFPVI